jgi:hypothetical protein
VIVLRFIALLFAFMNVLCDARPNSPLPAVPPNERALRKVQRPHEGQGVRQILPIGSHTFFGALPF